MLTGFSLFSRGEPFVWLTGGMLMICMAMMMGLLSLIVWQGLSTFWPRNILLVPTKDGGIAMGEDEGSDPQRLILRTGNFEVTGRHYTYVNSVDIRSNETLSPNHSWLYERIANGRLVGIPLSFQSSMSLTNIPSVRRIERLKEKIFSENTSSVDALRKELDKTQLELQRSEFITWMKSHLEDRSAKIYREEQLDKPLTDAQWTETSTKYVVQWEDPELFERQCHQSLEKIETRRSQVLQARRQLSRLDAQLHQATLRVKEFERSHSIDLLGELEELSSKVATISELNRTQEEIERAVEFVLSTDKLSDDSASLLRKMSSEFSQRTKDSRTAIENETKKSIQALLSKHPKAQSTIEQFFKEVEDTSKNRLEIQDDLQTLELPMEVDQWQIALPILETPLDWTREEWNTVVSDKRLSEAGASKLGVTTGEVIRVDLEMDSQSGQLIRLHTSDNQRMMLWGSFGDDRQVKVCKMTPKILQVEEVVRAYPSNTLGLWGKVGVYGSRWYEFVADDPREANSEGGVFPAIWGTIVMTFIMSIVVIPFGVMAALYLREYTNGGAIVALVRICINNLAGVPSIVYGVFGLAFFCYTIGGYVDGGPAKIGIAPWPSGWWFLVLTMTALLGFAAFSINLACMGNPLVQSTWKRRLAKYSGLFWIASLVGVVLLLAKTPFFDGFYGASLPTPTFGKGALLWASLTLSLLTLPVVIVATEEALSAVPNSLREGSYACGASKWQTIQRIVLPHARPGILTGSILAMARGAGEVAPLILVGALPSAVDLPLDGEYPFFHGSRSFMHLGFQIFHQGFMSQNSEASKPMVFTSTLLLILIIAMLNLVAIGMRSRLRKRFQGSQF